MYIAATRVLPPNRLNATLSSAVHLAEWAGSHVRNGAIWAGTNIKDGSVWAGQQLMHFAKVAYEIIKPIVLELGRLFKVAAKESLKFLKPFLIQVKKEVVRFVIKNQRDIKVFGIQAIIILAIFGYLYYYHSPAVTQKS